MEIVYFWIGEFRNIKKLGVNFGSEYIFNIKEEGDKYVITGEENKSYIRDFFSFEEGQSDIINLSAIVGDNGSGKTNFLEAFRRAITDERSHFDYIIIYKRKVKNDINFHVRSTVEYQSQIQMLDIHEHVIPHNEVIFYSPTLDLSIYPIRNETPIGIDVSSNWLLFADSHNETSARENLHIVEYHKAQDSLRQIKLVNKNILTNEIKNKIDIPKRVVINTVRTDFPHDATDLSRVRNVPHTFRKYYNLLVEKSNVVNDLAHEEDDARRLYGDNSEEYLYIRKQKCFAFFLYHLITNIYYNLEKTNHWLDQGEVGISPEDLEKLNQEDATIAFLRNQDLIDFSATGSFIEETKKSIFGGYPREESNDYCSWTVLPTETEAVINSYELYLLSLVNFSDYGGPNGLLDFDWVGLSTGERALFNLYSRFYYAKNQISVRRKERYKKGIKPLPNIIYILIDEGELGFHLQWQKDYIKELITWLPELLSFKDGAEVYKPKIQLIFATHSPISLSDVPNSHIIYLKKNYSNKTTAVLEGPERPTKSFGANVHTLMAHSFFLNDGLVGKLAVNKINGVIAILNDNNSMAEELEYASKVISIIDEPLLRKQLELQLAQKEGKTEKEFLEMELARIQERLRNL
ncbi:AAA family ATPase [Pontibacter sp. HSC-36F09]|uniref:AAA family ATPase n=1 Tax=Pontibacter sp. HSC-36F09 TaxID=2910966 RepID=UPI00209D6F3A|nr:AAA family ATPase [Pontibacter sp. HSC-36F09]MCP2044707.1 AAA15 family ATPase/GTPase [Pontibacter sp. HSC-36F09]